MIEHRQRGTRRFGPIGRAIGILVLAMLLSACGAAPAAGGGAGAAPSGSTAPAPPPTAAPAATSAPTRPAPAPGSGITVGIDNFSFTPATLTVTMGTEVTWTNHDDVPHTVTSTDGHFSSSPALDTDDHFTYRFTQPGTYPYFCSLHPEMTGQVIVH